MSEPQKPSPCALPTTRAAATVERILAATIEALADVGYQATTTRAIADRAGVSTGGMFRHFDSRMAVILAAVELINQRQLASVRRVVEQDRILDRDGFDELREIARGRETVALYELIVAGRHDDTLRERLYTLLREKARQIYEFTAEVPTMAALDDAGRAAFVHLAMRALHGAALLDMSAPGRHASRPRHETMLDLYEVLLRTNPAPGQPADSS